MDGMIGVLQVILLLATADLDDCEDRSGD